MVDTNQIVGIILTGNLNKLIGAIVIVLIGFLAARFLSNLTLKILNEFRTNKILKENFNIKFPIEQIIRKTLYYLILTISIIIALNQIGAATIILYTILFLILLIITCLALIALKDFIPNVIAGLWLYRKNLIKTGEIAEIREIKGEVIEANLSEIKVKTEDKEIILIPSLLLLKEKIKKIKK